MKSIDGCLNAFGGLYVALPEATAWLGWYGICAYFAMISTFAIAFG
jgi:hypothetical protein